MTTPQEFAKQLRRFVKFIALQDAEVNWHKGWGYPEHDLVEELHLSGPFTLSLYPSDIWDDMLGQDCFGTEGQLDPRGDRRD